MPDEPRSTEPPATTAPATDEAASPARSAAPVPAPARAPASAPAPGPARVHDAPPEAPPESIWRSVAAGGVGIFMALCIGSVLYPVLPQSWLTIPMLVLGGLAFGWGALWLMDQFDFGGNLRALLHRELLSYFLSPIAYMVLTGFMFCNGLTFILILYSMQGSPGGHGAPLQMLFGGTIFFWFVMVFAAPVLTMRTLAEERHSGTIETLMTAPVSDGQVVVAKYLGALIFFMTLWLPVGLFVGLMHAFAPPGGGPQIGPVLAGFTGTFLVGSMFIATGVLTSALSRNQIGAAIMAFAACLGLFFTVPIFVFFAGPEWKTLLAFFNGWDHMQEFGKGIVDSRRVIYYLSGTFLMLYMATKVLESGKWR
ncbi:MAG TPA: ABC transporter permease [Myxococcota bacterium]|jgi:ABC-2 type transport system permease protein|nr:ABC transporter permease [Myxococcota bacterium]